MPRHWIVALLLSLCALASPPTSITVAVDSNYPPYAFIGKNGELQGYTIERWKLWSHYTKIPVRFIYGDWAKMQQLVLEGKADVIDTIFKTPERLGLYRFSEPYADLPVAIFTHNIDRDIDDISSLKGKRIGVKEADANINYLRHHGIDNFTTYPNYEAIILAALNNEIDIFCMDEPPAFYFIAKSGRSEEFRHALHLYTGQFHYAVATNKEELLPLIEKGFSAIPASKIENIREQWLGTTTLNGRWKTITLYILAAALILTLLFLLWIAMLRWQVKKRTAQIDEERQRLHTLIHTIPDPVWITNLEGVFISCNKAFAQLVNKSEAEIVGKTDYDLVSEASADLFYAQDKKVLESTLPVTSEVTFQSPYSGETIYLEIIKSVVRNASGSVIGILGIARDVTERKKAQEELLRINATLEQRIEEELRRRRQQEELIIQQGRNIAISDTLGTIAHHWRQPLNLLALYLQNIKEELLGDQINREELIQTIDKAIDSLLALSKTIDEFRGVFSIHDEERLFALADVIDEVCAIYRSEMAAYGITIALDLDRSILMNAKPTLLKQLLLNIITNAKESLIEHPVANAMITISLAREGSETVIAICNNGEAIPPEVLPKIFDPYFSTKKELQGTGLGLYMTKAIVEKQMNGTIMAENTPEGVCFKIRLPLSS